MIGTVRTCGTSRKGSWARRNVTERYLNPRQRYGTRLFPENVSAIYGIFGKQARARKDSLSVWDTLDWYEAPGTGFEPV